MVRHTLGMSSVPDEESRAGQQSLVRLGWAIIPQGCGLRLPEQLRLHQGLSFKLLADRAGGEPGPWELRKGMKSPTFL